MTMEPRPAPPFSLPTISDLSPLQLGFLDEHFSTHQDLSLNASLLSSSLSQQCSQLDTELRILQNDLTKRAVSWISRSFSAKSALDELNRSMKNLSLRTSRHGVGSKKFQKLLNEELPRLAKELKRIESIRCYVETALQLEALVGDLEDAALFVMACLPGNLFSKRTSNSLVSMESARKHDKLLQAIKAMNDIEEVLETVVKFHSHWHSIVRSVDNRVDKILASLRPQVFSDHRALLVSLGVDDVLQPLIDRARLISCSAKEAWVSAMVQVLSGFLEKRIFSLLAERYKVKLMKLDAISTWLHLIDLIIAFDKQMQSLVNLDTGIFLIESEKIDGLTRGISVLTIFCNRMDWLKLWAKIEFKNAWKKLKVELKEEKMWMVDNKYKSSFDMGLGSEHHILSTLEDHRAPPITEIYCGQFLWCFFKILLLRFKSTELHPDDPDDDAIVRICGLVNGARYIQTKLREWSDSLEFLELKIAEKDSSKLIEDDVRDIGSFYGEEIRSLSEMEINWLMEIIAVILRQFELISWEYVKNVDNFEQERDDKNAVGVTQANDLAVSTDLVQALDAIKSWLRVLRININSKDFSDLWRSLADGLDHYISRSFATKEIRFSGKGIHQFEADMQALLFVFQPFCARPQAFFPCIKEILKLLKQRKEEAKQLQAVLSNGENGARCLRLHGISHLSVHQVVQVLRNRNFASAIR
ncbi:hypothetical protein K1719_038467 [Acacia pycnantha]|nr:hypothetical protein K1719_038467 [Acacia pycnantha]